MRAVSNSTYPNMFSKYWYYLCSIATLLFYSSNPFQMILIFLFPDNHQRKTIHLRNGLKFTITSKIQLWTIKETIFDRCYEKGLIKFQDGWRVIDIGAAFGDFSVWMAQTYPNIKIMAFEPHQGSFELAQSNIKANGITNVDLRNKAVASSSSLTTIALKDILADMPVIDLVKMDCEGAEYDIFLNTSMEVTKKIRYVTMEWHDGVTQNKHEDLVKHLENGGFEVQVRLNPVHANIGLLFARNRITL